MMQEMEPAADNVEDLKYEPLVQELSKEFPRAEGYSTDNL